MAACLNDLISSKPLVVCLLQLLNMRDICILGIVLAVLITMGQVGYQLQKKNPKQQQQQQQKTDQQLYNVFLCFREYG